MKVHCQAETFVAAPLRPAFAMTVDPVRFPEFFTGYGPIAGIESVIVDAPLRPGSIRRVLSKDGSQLSEAVTVLDPPLRHAYVLTGFGRPFSWLVRRGEADWTATASGDGTRLRWDYHFTLASPFAWPLAWPLLKICMTGAMRRCLANMAAAHAQPRPPGAA
ncbi:MAG: hypothetical protein A3E01_04280 [Gammaproteobacteria bacterium RIFCSPHIGHO2_12_FULL_63_22]|nr:MAG: hypothetical protein A3E01_04280 [Gammaproteobacteria bacterium RIFCSPHIGHO2_12_FULL_63_22]